MAVELTANWAPLEGKLTPELCGEFMWMFREGGIEHYKHIVTRRYLRLDRDGPVPDPGRKWNDGGA